MTRKHFEAIARVLRTEMRDMTVTVGERMVVERIARDLAEQFAEENPRFDTERFLAASGVEGR